MSTIVDRHRAFRALLASLAMPGTRNALPQGADLQLLLETVHGANWSDLTIASSNLEAHTIAAAPIGEEISPENGATLYLAVDASTEWTAARIHGPGIRGSREVSVPLGVAAIEARNRACASFPRGIDIVAVDLRDIIAFPRTTSMTVRA
jgi:phosphonate C-P lyase system protein PhnH